MAKKSTPDYMLFLRNPYFSENTGKPEVRFLKNKLLCRYQLFGPWSFFKLVQSDEPFPRTFAVTDTPTVAPLKKTPLRVTKNVNFKKYKDGLISKILSVVLKRRVL